MATSQAGRVLGVQLIPILLLDKHVIALSTKRFCQQKQLRRIQRSLDDDPIATLVHSSVVIRVDYSLGLLAGTPKDDRQATTSPHYNR